MKLDAYTLFDELNISYDTNSEHSRPGWIQFCCPYCEDTKDHLGFNLIKEYFHCWHCGWHPLIKTIADLSYLSKWEASQAVDRHRTGRHLKVFEKEIVHPKHVELPYRTGPLKKIHIDYLIGRGFTYLEVKELQKRYNILGTGPVGDYKLRVIFPILHYGKLVSYQGRDITNKSRQKYLACAGKNEVRSIKDCLFGADLVRGNRVVVVEGIMASIKLGPGSVATFGAQISWSQIKQIADRWEYRYIAFDPDEAGREGAAKICSALSGMPGKTYRVDISKKKDLDKFTSSESEEFMNEIGIKNYA